MPCLFLFFFVCVFFCCRCARRGPSSTHPIRPARTTTTSNTRVKSPPLPGIRPCGAGAVTWDVTWGARSASRSAFRKATCPTIKTRKTKKHDQKQERTNKRNEESRFFAPSPKFGKIIIIIKKYEGGGAQLLKELHLSFFLSFFFPNSSGDSTVGVDLCRALNPPLPHCV